VKTLRLGDRELARMGIGTNRLHHSPENVEFIRTAASAGVGLIDTAHLYAGGDSESTIGAAFGGLTPRPFVATKGGFGRGEGKPEILSSQIEQSLARLQVEQIDLYYLHRVDPDTPLEDSLGAIARYVERGAISNVGLSEVGIDEIDRAREIVRIAAVQNRYNLDDRQWDEVVDYCEREAIAFVPFYPLHTPSTAPQVALALLLRRSSVMLPIPGTLSLGHVRENVAALDLELTDEQFEALSKWKPG